MCSDVCLSRQEPLQRVLPCLLPPPAGGPGNFIYMQLSGDDAPSKTGEEDDDEEQVATLVSPLITSPDADLCMSFWYHMFGEHAGALHIKQRKEAEASQILWTVSGHQGSRWREGRVLLPHSSVSYQVTAEVFKSYGHFSFNCDIRGSTFVCDSRVIS